MSDIQTLIEMGFPKDRAQRALEVTNNAGVEPAMEWLLAHSDEEIPTHDIDNSQNANLKIGGNSSSSSVGGGGSSGEVSGTVGESSSSNSASTNENAATGDDSDVVASGSNSAANNTPTTEQPQEAKSLKCDDCNKLFKSQTEVTFHAAKTGHSNFSESVEEKKPLTEEEKKAQLALIEEKLKLKRAEREERERFDALEREKNRIKSGKDLTEAKKRLEDMEMQKVIEQRKREKEEDKAARDRVRAQIEADKAARKAKLANEQGKPVQSPATSTTTSVPSSSTSQPQKNYTNTRIQIRLQDGSTYTETFGVKEQLSAIRVFIQMRQGNDLPFGLMTSFPRRVFTDEDYEKPLEVLGLVPSAVIIVTKAH